MSLNYLSKSTTFHEVDRLVRFFEVRRAMAAVCLKPRQARTPKNKKRSACQRIRSKQLALDSGDLCINYPIDVQLTHCRCPSTLACVTLRGGLYLFAALRRFRKILFWIHVDQLLEIFYRRAKVSWSFEEPATVVNEMTAFIVIGTVLFSCAVSGVRRHDHKPQSASIVIVVIIVPRRIFTFFIMLVPPDGPF